MPRAVVEKSAEWTQRALEYLAKHMGAECPGTERPC